MSALWFVSLLWAFSFGLIKGNLAGLDASFVSFARLGLSALLFLPFLRPRSIPRRDALTLVVVGAVQFGLMYVLYIAAYRHLKGHEVALLTIPTPLFIVLLDDARARALRKGPLAAAALAVLGAFVIKGQAFVSESATTGVLLMLASDLCFAAGQLHYRDTLARHPNVEQRSVFGFLYLGAVCVPVVTMAFSLEAVPTVSFTQVWTLGFLGIGASGIGFFLWNWGATKVSAGELAVMNDLKIPIAVVVSLLVFGEDADVPRLLAGGAVLAGALALARKTASPSSTAAA